MRKDVFSLLPSISQSAYCTNLVMNSQSLFDPVAYYHHWEFPIKKDKAPTLTWPIILPVVRHEIGDHS